MKPKLKSTFLAVAALCAAPFASAQLTLNNFNAFATDTAFVGDWDDGTNGPRPPFVQGVGAFDGSFLFDGGKNDSESYAEHFFPNAPVDITGYSLIQISVRLLPSNAAKKFTISLFSDPAGGSLGSADAVFDTALIGLNNFTVLTVAWNSTGFDPSQLTSFRVTGGVLGGVQPLGIAIGELAVAAPSVMTAVPEPSSYAAMSAAMLLALVAARRFCPRR